MPARSGFPKALAELQRQSGNPTGRLSGKVRPERARSDVKVQFDKTPFWPAFDQLLDQAGLTIYPYSEERAIYVVAATEKKRTDAGRVCCNGSFRFEPTGIVARRDLRSPRMRR